MKTSKIIITKRAHPGFQEWKTLPVKIKKQLRQKKPWIGKWQYFYEGNNGVISLVCLRDTFYKEDVYEIYCIDGTISLKEELPDTNRFKTKKEAEKRIKELFDLTE